MSNTEEDKSYKLNIIILTNGACEQQAEQFNQTVHRRRLKSIQAFQPHSDLSNLLLVDREENKHLK
eukprot:6360858-Amphidinium_carterae.1